jgi:hypothetical protein
VKRYFVSFVSEDGLQGLVDSSCLSQEEVSILIKSFSSRRELSELSEKDADSVARILKWAGETRVSEMLLEQILEGKVGVDFDEEIEQVVFYKIP